MIAALVLVLLVIGSVWVTVGPVDAVDLIGTVGWSGLLVLVAVTALVSAVVLAGVAVADARCRAWSLPPVTQKPRRTAPAPAPWARTQSWAVSQTARHRKEPS